MNFLTLQEVPLKNKRVMIRADLNVPMQAGKITNNTKLRAILPSLKAALKENAAVLLISHLGRPEPGKYQAEFSLKPLVKPLSQLLKKPIQFSDHWLDHPHLSPGQVLLGENLRFNVGEEENDPELAKKMAALCDVFVMDAFATAHRAQASTEGVIHYAPVACGGLLLTQELTALNKIFEHPEHPLLAIVGGAKVSSKLLVLKNLLQKVDSLILGGGMANTFIKALGYSVGNSLYEPEFVEDARQLLKEAKRQNKYIVLPEDVIVAKEISEQAESKIKKISDLEEDDIILDVGPFSSQNYLAYITDAKTIIWNGPLGMFELAPFAQGTQKLAEAIAASSAFTVAGGGETLAAIDKFKVQDKISYISTGGGAFLEYLEGRSLPAVQALEARRNRDA